MLLKSYNSLSFCGNNYITIQLTSSKVSKWKDEWCINILSKFQDKIFHNNSFTWKKTLSSSKNHKSGQTKLEALYSVYVFKVHTLTKLHVDAWWYDKVVVHAIVAEYEIVLKHWHSL